MWKTFVLLFCLSVALGVGYSATNGTTTATPTASNTSSTAKPPTTRNLTTPSNKSSTAKPTPTTKSTKGNTTTKPAPSTNSTTKPTVTSKPTKGNSTTKTAPSTNSTSTPTVTSKPTKGNSTTKTAPSTNSTSTPTVTSKPTKGNSTTKTTPSTSSTTKPTASTKPTNGTVSTSQSTTKKTTTVLPTTPPPYGIFSLRAKDKNTTYCLLAQFAVTFTINYRANVSKGNSSKIVEKNVIIYLNRTNYKNVTIDGVCGSNVTDAKLVLTWPKKNFYNLTMVFSEVKPKGLEAESNSSKWRVKEVILNVTLMGNPDFKDATEKNFTSTFNGSSSPTYDVGGYYSCNTKGLTAKFNTTANNTKVQPVFEDVKLEPFVSKNASDAFGNDKYPCPQDMPKSSPTPTKSSDKNNDIVPIAVGCALAGLVLIVLIAYIIGRRKSHRGYEKV